LRGWQRQISLVSEVRVLVSKVRPEGPRRRGDVSDVEAAPATAALLPPVKISVLICTRDRPDLIGHAVESVAACRYDNFDLHVMDQSTTDATKVIVEELSERFADRCTIVYHHLDKAGLSRAYNEGVRVSDGPLIACTDDDVIVPPDWLSRIAAAFAADPDLGLLYGQVLVPESLREVLDRGTIVPVLEWDRPERLWSRDRNFKIWGMGANMAVRRSLFGAVHGFDEAMGGGAPLRSSQDFDFAYRVYRSHHAILLDPSVKVDHYGTREPDQWPATERAYGIGNGAFFAKHVRCGDPLAVYLLVRALVRAVAQAVYRSVRARRLIGVSLYGRSLLTGLRESTRFGVDRRTRLYTETARAKIHVTDANAITGAKRAS
jgi:glycosyltransferase involved in cell wall biosynthesis